MSTIGFLSVADVAKRWKVSRQRVHHLVKYYGVKFTRIADVCLLTPEDLRTIRHLQAHNKYKLKSEHHRPNRLKKG